MKPVGKSITLQSTLRLYAHAPHTHTRVRLYFHCFRSGHFPHTPGVSVAVTKCYCDGGPWWTKSFFLFIAQVGVNLFGKKATINLICFLGVPVDAMPATMMDDIKKTKLIEDKILYKGWLVPRLCPPPRRPTDPP